MGSEEEAEITSASFAEVNGLLGTARDLASRGLLVSVRSFGEIDITLVMNRRAGVVQSTTLGLLVAI